MNSSDEEVVSHWHLLLEEISFSPRQFYDIVLANVEDKQIRGVDMEEVYLREGGLFSDKRLYLRISSRQYTFYIYASSFGRDFFVSYWLLAGGFMTPDDISFYQHDAASMFFDLVSSAIQKAVDEVRAIYGREPTTADEHKPIMEDF